MPRYFKIVSLIPFLVSGLFWMAACTPLHNEVTRPDALASPPLEFTVPEIAPIVLPNGIRVYLFEDRELPLVRISAMVGSGSINDPDELEGRGDLFAAVLEEGGAGDRTPEQFADYLQDLAIDLSVDIDAYATAINMSLLSEDLDAGFSLLDDLLRRPRFAPERVELARRQMLESIRRQDDDPQSVAQRLFNAAVYGEHPFGRSATVATVNGLTRDHLLEFHRDNFVPENLWLAISGDFNRTELEGELGRVFGKWARGHFSPPPIPPLQAPGKAAIWLASKQIPQTTVMIGDVGVSKDNPDMLTVRVMNAILGGSGFNSRLMREIRSNRGLAYSVYSYFMIGRRLPGSFIASGETKNETAVEMTSLMLDEMNRIRSELVSEEELELAKQSRINSFVFAFEDSHDVLTQQMRLDFYDYPDDYMRTYRDKVRQITREEVLRVAREYLRPEQLTIVLVGQPADYETLADRLQRPVRLVPLNGSGGE